MQTGDTVPDFEAVDQEGNPVTLSSLVAEGPIVLFFYPRAMTTGCTAESCHFRDLSSEFAQVGARPVGISDDPPEKQKKFDGKNRLGFTLLSDPDKKIAATLGAKRVGPFPNRRVTYVIDQDRTILEVIRSETKMDLHADRALDTLRSS